MAAKLKIFITRTERSTIELTDLELLINHK
jgi:hypothetical protein